MKKKVLLYILSCILLLFVIILGYNNYKLKEAKEYIDEIYSSYDKIDQTEAKLLYEKDAEKRESLERDIRIYNEIIEIRTRHLAEIYVNLSENQQKKVDDYLSNTVGRRILNIWSY